MMPKKRIYILAKTDLREAALWYEKASSGLGKRFLREVNDEVQYICQNPLAQQIRYGIYRISFLKTFPYGIHYEYVEEKNQINIFAVFHTSRNPAIWTERTQIYSA
ncbi:MAG: type II toxin-antitoxin system RelE/ParE family toxin [Prevotellaceae bacterium]|jgi:plasmid stabilization system protein ParE|nr:type II toxin-antitoxin system RelE/ParE family toxin [Prevotellaceae bacterium]